MGASTILKTMEATTTTITESVTGTSGALSHALEGDVAGVCK